MVHDNSSETAMLSTIRRVLARGVVIPAHPLALDASRRLDERRQRALSRYYIAAGAGGLAVGVHTTQFEIRQPQIGLFRPVLQLAREEMDRADAARGEPLLRVGGICGPTAQAVAEAATIRELGYHAGLLSLAALRAADDAALLAHCRAVAEIVPLIGFYLQPAVGGRVLSYAFWRRFLEIDNVVAVKIAPFNRYQTLDVVRAVAESGRDDVALYTGNDDNIVLDLLTPFRFRCGGRWIERRIVGGLLGHWAAWTRRAVELLEECHRWGLSQFSFYENGTVPLANAVPLANGPAIPAAMLQRSIEVTDCNAALFDAANAFAGCICGIHEVLRRQGLLAGTWCLNPHEQLSPGQTEEIDRITAAYPHLTDDAFVAEHRDEWLNC
ncbi:MAG: dihydrodipicolinate synthase family protein [Thermoguttaceae bacterium]|jgi:dihydrodipicolinate synthase/N-acetylneuraminate lyase